MKSFCREEVLSLLEMGRSVWIQQSRTMGVDLRFGKVSPGSAADDLAGVDSFSDSLEVAALEVPVLKQYKEKCLWRRTSFCFKPVRDPREAVSPAIIVLVL